MYIFIYIHPLLFTQVRSETAAPPGLPTSAQDPTSSVVWRWLADFWPLEERPSVLRDPLTVSTMSVTDLHMMHKSHTLTQKETKGKSKKDTAPPLITFPEEKDDCKSSLHGARWLRYPLAPIKEWYGQTPKQRKPIYKAMRFKFFGAANCLANKTIELAHDQTNVLSLKHFHSENCTVSSRSKKEIKRVNEEGEVENEVTDGWKSVVGVQEAREAINNYFVLMFNLWSHDPTPIIMNRVLNKYNYCGVARNEPTTRVQILTNFFNSVLQQSADRNINGDEPLSFNEQEEIMKSKITKAKYSTDSNIPEKQARTAGKQDPKVPKAATHGTSQLTFSSKPSATKGTGLKTTSGYLTCFGFNALDGRACTNPTKNAAGIPSTVGCFANNGRVEYAHACSHQKIPNGPICGAGHRRKDHK